MKSRVVPIFLKKKEPFSSQPIMKKIEFNYEQKYNKILITAQRMRPLLKKEILIELKDESQNDNNYRYALMFEKIKNVFDLLLSDNGSFFVFDDCFERFRKNKDRIIAKIDQLFPHIEDLEKELGEFILERNQRILHEKLYLINNIDFLLYSLGEINFILHEKGLSFENNEKDREKGETLTQTLPKRLILCRKYFDISNNSPPLLYSEIEKIEEIVDATEQKISKILDQLFLTPQKIYNKYQNQFASPNPIDKFLYFFQKNYQNLTDIRRAPLIRVTTKILLCSGIIASFVLFPIFTSIAIGAIILAKNYIDTKTKKNPVSISVVNTLAGWAVTYFGARFIGSKLNSFDFVSNIIPDYNNIMGHANAFDNWLKDIMLKFGINTFSGISNYWEYFAGAIVIFLVLSKLISKISRSIKRKNIVHGRRVQKNELEIGDDAMSPTLFYFPQHETIEKNSQIIY